MGYRGRNYEVIIFYLDIFNIKIEGKNYIIFSSRFFERIKILIFLIRVVRYIINKDEICRII